MFDLYFRKGYSIFMHPKSASSQLKFIFPEQKTTKNQPKFEIQRRAY